MLGTKIGQLETSLNTKQATLTSTTNITTGTISSGNITAPTISASTYLLYGSTNVGDKNRTIGNKFKLQTKYIDSRNEYNYW